MGNCCSRKNTSFLKAISSFMHIDRTTMNSFSTFWAPFDADCQDHNSGTKFAFLAIAVNINDFVMKEEKMNQPEPDKDLITPTNPAQSPTKPEPIEKWENEGGQVIPTGSLPKVVFPESEADKAKSQPQR
jgi:hypothetical protein